MTRRSGKTPRLPWIVVAALAVASLGAVAWHKRVRHEFMPDNFGVVAPGIYRSAQLTERMLRRVVDEHGIRTIIDLSVRDPPSQETEMERRVAGELAGVQREEFSLEGDGTGDWHEYVAALRVMTDPGRQPVLVHCSAGAQRTGVLVMLYRHVVEGMPLIEANAESFEYGRDPDDWIAVAYLAENLAAISAAYEREVFQRTVGSPGDRNGPEP